MVFSSIIFLFFFIPIFLICYFLAPAKIRNYVLLIFSLFFYGFGEPVYVFLIVILAFLDYLHGLFLVHFKSRPKIRRFILAISIITDVSVLVFFKYINMLFRISKLLINTDLKLDIALPIGLSFFTFQTTSYTIDVYKEKIEPERNYFYYLTYVSMFPQLIAGPIVRFEDIQEKLHSRNTDLEKFSSGFYRFLMGLFKKVLLANNLGIMVDYIASSAVSSNSSIHMSTVLTSLSQLDVATAWLGAIGFTLQLYLDFSGYSDMAIGLGAMLGFDFPENFNYPLASDSITEFWRRWHISLSGWFRDYVYIPLGGNRCSRIRNIINIFIVWSLTGLWHGASFNFLIWGLYYAVLLTLEKYLFPSKNASLSTKPASPVSFIIRHIYSIFIVVVGFVIFYFDNTHKLADYLSAMFHISGNSLTSNIFTGLLANYWVFLLLGIIVAFPIFPCIKKPLEYFSKAEDKHKKALYLIFEIIKGLIILALFLLTVCYIISGSYNPFLYFRF